MPPKKSSKALAKLQKQIQRVESESANSSNGTGTSAWTWRLGTVLERRARARRGLRRARDS